VGIQNLKERIRAQQTIGLGLVGRISRWHSRIRENSETSTSQVNQGMPPKKKRAVVRSLGDHELQKEVKYIYPAGKEYTDMTRLRWKEQNLHQHFEPRRP
jgi:hypothetical protein